jgi:predicted DNA-binding transcriptional regulator YafY
MQQYQRHAEIIDRLQNGEILSITELSREWKVSSKTVQRDVGKLMEGNYGIERAEDGKRIRIKFNVHMAKGAETTIGVLDSLASQIGGDFYVKAQSALHKLQRYIASPFYTRIDVEDISSKLGLMEKIEDAISKQHMITFKYKKWQDPHHVKTYENVHPYKIVVFDGFWYLLGKYKKHYIKFYIKEINDLQTQGKTFQLEEKVIDRMQKAINIYFDPQKEPFEVVLLLDKNAIVYFERKPIKGQRLTKNRDGTANLEITLTHKQEVFYILKKWLPQIRVIEPYHLQEEFEDMVRNYLPDNSA